MIGKWEKAQDGHLYHPAIIIPADKENERLEEIKKFSPNYNKTIIPCRKCIGCRLDYSRDWANRGYLESLKSDHNYFITLTYDDKHLPIDDKITTSKGVTYERTEDWKGNLQPKRLTKFIHDLRQWARRELNHTGIKYLACGEYGETNQRPHYHIIIFNCPIPSDTFYEPRIIDHEYFWRNKIIERYWEDGISNISIANWSTIAYVSRYVTKKLYGNNAEDIRAQKGQIAEFIRVSNGIGKDYWKENKEKILQTDSITIKNHAGVHTTKPPKYFTRLLKTENSEKYEDIKIKRERENFMGQQAKNQMHTYGQLEQLEIMERTKATNTTMLKRTL